VALRAVLGAGRERLARQLLTENLMLAGGGGLLGGLVAWIGLPLLVRLVPNTLPIADTPTLDLRVLAGAALVTIVTGVGFGLLPALRASRSDAAALQEGSRAGVGGRRERLRAVLVVAAIAVSAMLSISSGLLIRALWRLQAIDPGFQAEHVLTLRTSLPMPAYEQTARRERFYARVLSGVRALPGVTNVGYTSFLPIVVRGGVFAVTVEGESLKESAARKVSLRFITPGFFEALRIPLRRGRDVVASDTGTAPLTAIVSESFVRQHWPDRDPIGQRVLIADQMRTVVGVVGDVRVRGRETTSEPQVYAPSAQMVDGLRVWYAPKDLVIRSTAETSALLPAIRAIIAGAEPAQPISDVRTMTDILDEETASRIAQARVLSLFDAVTFLLAAVGIHGLLSFAVSHRSQEIGVRMALGAQARDILRMVLGQSLLMATIGITLGVALAYLVARSLQTLLLGLSPADPLTFSVGIIVALAMTLAGSTAPALRAIHVDPMSAMRAE
jgi:putative ABC transport system permease protein